MRLVTLSLSLSLTLSLAAVLGCGADPEASCASMCTTDGFADGSAEVYDHETNCMCEGGEDNPQVTDASCTDYCSGIGFESAEPFGTGCSCS